MKILPVTPSVVVVESDLICKAVPDVIQPVK